MQYYNNMLCYVFVMFAKAIAKTGGLEPLVHLLDGQSQAVKEPFYLKKPTTRKFKDVVLEDVVFDNIRCDIDVTITSIDNRVTQ